ELLAITHTIHRWISIPINIVTDSEYCYRLALCCALSLPGTTTLARLLQSALEQRSISIFFVHINSHTTLPGVMTEGNRRADEATSTPLQVAVVGVPALKQAQLSHQFFHQGTRALARIFVVPLVDARAIIAACPSCKSISSVAMGINPRGLQANQIWQQDITEYSPFGRFKYLHVSVDTCSGCIYATVEIKGNARAAIRRCAAFATLGVPQQIKTDNGPFYKSSLFNNFLQNWGVEHRTGIPGNSGGQAIVERAHQTVK
ncbi:hypothetical protein N324_11619, partial [Chlamydotis macqueenii]